MSKCRLCGQVWASKPVLVWQSILDCYFTPLRPQPFLKRYLTKQGYMVHQDFVCDRCYDSVISRGFKHVLAYSIEVEE